MLRAASVVRTDLHLEVGGLEDVVTVTAEGQNNITLESQAIARGLDEQQLRDLPRNSRDIQDFLTLNPERGRRLRRHPVPRRAHLRRLVHPGRPAVERRHLRRAVECRARTRRHPGSAGALEFLQRGIRRPGRRDRLDQARREPLPRHVVLRLQLERAERADLRAGAERRLAQRSERRHARLSLRRQRRRPDRHQPDVLLRQLRRQQAEGAAAAGRRRWCRRRRCAAATSPARVHRCATRRPAPQFPGNRIPAERIDPAARKILDFFYPLPNQTNTSNGGFGTYREILPLTRNRDRADVRVDHELAGRDSLFSRFSWQTRDPDAFTFESTGGNGGTGLTNLGLLDRESKPSRWPSDGRGSGPARWSTSSAAATAPTRATARATSSPGTSPDARHPGAAARGRRARVPVVPLLRPEPAVRHPRPAPERLPRSRSVLVFAEQQHHVAEAAPFA